MLSLLYFPPSQYGRAPRGARGLKCLLFLLMIILSTSRPSRGAWIEISSGSSTDTLDSSRPSRGAWIEMFPLLAFLPRLLRRAPRGARGLKFRVFIIKPKKRRWSRPSRGAWIEIHRSRSASRCADRRAPRGARGLKFPEHGEKHLLPSSRPSRGAWIEIFTSP